MWLKGASPSGLPITLSWIRKFRQILNCSNFFVFQICVLRFSGCFYLNLIRSFLTVLVVLQLPDIPDNRLRMTTNECEIEVGKMSEIWKSTHFEHEFLEYSNCFVFQSCELRFSGSFYRILIRSFPESFCFLTHLRKTQRLEQFRQFTFIRTFVQNQLIFVNHIMSDSEVRSGDRYPLRRQNR